MTMQPSDSLLFWGNCWGAKKKIESQLLLHVIEDARNEKAQN